MTIHTEMPVPVETSLKQFSLYHDQNNTVDIQTLLIFPDDDEMITIFDYKFEWICMDTDILPNLPVWNCNCTFLNQDL